MQILTNKFSHQRVLLSYCPYTYTREQTLVLFFFQAHSPSPPSFFSSQFLIFEAAVHGRCNASVIGQVDDQIDYICQPCRLLQAQVWHIQEVVEAFLFTKCSVVRCLRRFLLHRLRLLLHLLHEYLSRLLPHWRPYQSWAAHGRFQEASLRSRRVVVVNNVVGNSLWLEKWKAMESELEGVSCVATSKNKRMTRFGDCCIRCYWG